MAYPFFDGVRTAVSTAPGTGAVTPSLASSGFRGFAGVVPPNCFLTYRLDDGTAWEIGNGWYNGTTLTRGLKYSSSGSLIDGSIFTTVSLVIAAEEVQPHVGIGKWGLLSAVPAVAAPSAVGTAGTVVGGAAAASVSTTSFLTRQHRNTVSSSAATVSGAGYTLAGSLVSISETAGLGGFEFIAKLGIVAFSSGVSKLQVGVASSSSVNPTPTTNMLLFGMDAGDTSIFFFANSNGSTPLKVNTGIVPVVNGFYEFVVTNNPCERKIYWSIVRLDTFTGASGFVTDSSVLPVNNTLLIPQAVLSTGTSTTAVSMAFQSMYIRSGF